MTSKHSGLVKGDVLPTVSREMEVLIYPNERQEALKAHLWQGVFAHYKNLSNNAWQEYAEGIEND